MRNNSLPNVPIILTFYKPGDKFPLLRKTKNDRKHNGQKIPKR